MPIVPVRDLPEPVQAELARRAPANGQSLQQCLAQQLTRLTLQPTFERILERAAQREGVSVRLQQAVDNLDELHGQR